MKNVNNTRPFNYKNTYINCNKSLYFLELIADLDNENYAWMHGLFEAPYDWCKSTFGSKHNNAFLRTFDKF